MSEDFIFLIHPLKENYFDVFIAARFQESKGESTPQIRYSSSIFVVKTKGKNI